MHAALELCNLPPTSTFEELRALCGARSAVFSLGASHRALVLFDSHEAAASARELLHGADWGTGVPLVATDVPQGPVGWLAAEVPGYLPPGTIMGPSSSSAALASQQQQQQQQQQAAVAPAPAPLPVATPTLDAEPPYWAEGVGDEWLPVWDPPGDAAAAVATATAPGSSEAAPDSSWRAARPSSARAAGPGRPRSAHGQQASGSGGAADPNLSDVRIMLRNLNPEVKQRQVEAACLRFGKLVQCLKHPGKRFAHVQFARPEAAASALPALHMQLVPELNPDGPVYAEYSTLPNDRAVRRGGTERR